MGPAVRHDEASSCEEEDVILNLMGTTATMSIMMGSRIAFLFPSHHPGGRGGKEGHLGNGKCPAHTGEEQMLQLPVEFAECPR